MEGRPGLGMLWGCWQRKMGWKKYGGEGMNRKKWAEKGKGGHGTPERRQYWQRGGNIGRGYLCIAKCLLPDLGPAGPSPWHWCGTGWG